MAEVQPKKYSLFAPGSVKNGGPDRSDREVNIPQPNTVDPMSPDDTYSLQEKFRNDDTLYKGFSKRNDNDIVNTMYNAMLMSAANPYYKNNFGKNDINGRMNGKTYNATLNMQRLVDRYNNRARLRQDPGSVNEYGANAGLGTIEYNKPIETVDTRQYAQDMAVAAEQRGKDLNRADTVASAVAKKFAKSKEQEIMVNEFLTQNEANINRYARQMFMDTQHRMPTQTMLSENLLAFGEDYRYYMKGKIYNQAVALSYDHVFMELWTQIAQGVESPDQYEMLMGAMQNRLLNVIGQYGASDFDAALWMNYINNVNAVLQSRQDRSTATTIATETATDLTGKKGTQTSKQFVEGKK